jgi:hypothetical protein
LSFFSTRSSKFSVNPIPTNNISSGEFCIDTYIHFQNLTKVVSVLDCILAVNGTRFVNGELPDCSGLSQDSV